MNSLERMTTDLHRIIDELKAENTRLLVELNLSRQRIAKLEMELEFCVEDKAELRKKARR